MTTKRTAEERAMRRFPHESSEYFDGETSYGPSWRVSFATCIREEVEPLEAENAKLRDLLQELVNDMRRLRIEFGNRTGTTTQVGIASLESAKEQGFVPTNTTEDNGN